MQRVLARATVIVLLCDLAVVGVRRAGSTTRVHIRTHTLPTRTVVVLPEGQSIVTGTATSLTVDADGADPVAVPFTVDAATATLDGILVGGQRETAAWNGGCPLVIDGQGAGLDPSPAHVELDATGAVVSLDGSPRPFLAGTYRTAAPVAVGTGGLATPQDGVAFQADESTSLAATGRIRMAPRPLRFHGPGRAVLRGALDVRTREGTRHVASLAFGPGSFELALVPAAGGWSVQATLQGPVTQEG